jgi:DNA topoisomerase-6 subunit B
LKSLEPVTSVLKPDQQKLQNKHSSYQKEEQKIVYNKKAESEFFVDNSALAGFTGERI